MFGPIAAAGAAALAGVAGSSLLGKHKKNKKHKHGGVTGMMGHGAGPAALIGGMSSLLGGNKHGGGGVSRKVYFLMFLEYLPDSPSGFVF